MERYIKEVDEKKGRLVQSRNTEATAREYQDSHRRSNGRLRRGRLEQNKTDYATQIQKRQTALLLYLQTVQIDEEQEKI